MTFDTDWQWGVSAVGQDRLLIWLEPWAEEFEIPLRSSLTLRFSSSDDFDRLCSVESREDQIVIWANGGTMVCVYIDGVLQESASATVPVPGDFGDATKGLLSIMFAAHPAARLGGEGLETQAPPSFWQRVKRRLGL